MLPKNEVFIEITFARMLTHIALEAWLKRLNDAKVCKGFQVQVPVGIKYLHVTIITKMDSIHLLLYRSLILVCNKYFILGTNYVFYLVL